MSVAPASTNTLYYTVPAGYVAVLRSMTFGYAEPARAAGVMSVVLSPANSRIWVVLVVASSAGSATWEGRLVMPAGEQIRASYTGTPGQWLTASGYLLALP